ncbi:two-component system sensor histidine kinase VanS [Curtobacterium sp. PhB130]|uniref:sensor histidine kinase n=1 Tax=unclassified Curtobacterium TaxID=257496 RepID=UPI000F4C2B41|nr:MULTISPECIES: HAMP domain-containing sensor histidine kinase [unclassified Curtobacterium]ROS78052.1 two-component system sensor histidine kinase VanS [Curtobacterium sp. PhB130]TCK65631.1 two-component system sensor histidine kinase VanS [Curtobacterium sp. PhB136]
MSTRTRLTLTACTVFTLAALAAFAGLVFVIQDFPAYAVDRGEFPRRSEVIRMVVTGAAVAIAFFAVVGAVFAWVLAGTLLRPLDRIARAALSAADGDLSQRVGLRRSDEFGRLAATFDLMLDRLQDAVAVHERFAANAAHELRTPLAVIRTVTEVAQASPEHRDVDEVLRRIAVTNRRATETCEALLELSDANRVSMRRRPEALGPVVADALEEVLPALEQAGVQVGVDIGPGDVVLECDRRLLRQALRNLLDNVARHGAPGTATMTVLADASDVLIRCENPGETLDPERVGRLAEPFLRGGGRGRSGAERGHGLGLALVARVAAVHGGALDLRPRPGGGLVVEIRLPR